MENLLSEGVSLMVFGMGFVFVFLTLLVFATSLMSKLVVKYQPAPEPKPSARKAAKPSAGTGSAAATNDELVAVISAAVHKYRSR
ncbi:hypothetical protein GCM10011348_31740 [Marinobacterium nitratireducens]|uniref:Probable oxaloacetate decarboxylase gamma chain n=1 Tax=Marinobacterium nitratireducens TaxID=518897 RepID=A0A917ZMA3_9GAMM|nr:OadG family protein [Marinobacterium nitratireducens]GGO84764.1 hypothetical protein GCM10011348_31740 [Marinobacterium nitratireducens]